MTPDRFLQKLVDVLGMIKAPVIIIICVIAIIQVISAVFIGGHDKRAVFSTVAHAPDDCCYTLLPGQAYSLDG